MRREALNRNDTKAPSNTLVDTRSFLRPALPVIFPFNRLGRRQDPDWIEAIQHDCVLIGMGLGRLVGQGLRVRGVLGAARMQGCHPGIDVVLTEKISVVIEDELIVIRIAMKERNTLGRGILLERARDEAADYGPLGD